jgi:polyhydroxyalkanoate synthesis regulator phasin
MAGWSGRQEDIVRKKLIIAGAAGALTLAGLGVALPALADDDTPTAGISSEDRIRDALAGLVTDGSITQEQADEVASTLDDAGIGGHGGGHGWGGRLGLSTAAETLGLTEDELRTALEADDASLATVAEAQGVEVDALVDALVQAQTDRITQAVTDGELTQEEADERLADLEERITERVNSTDLGGMRGGHGPRGGDGD